MKVSTWSNLMFLMNFPPQFQSLILEVTRLAAADSSLRKAVVT